VESDEDKGSLAPLNDVQFDGTILVAEDNVINQKLIKQIPYEVWNKYRLGREWA